MSHQAAPTHFFGIPLLDQPLVVRVLRTTRAILAFIVGHSLFVGLYVSFRRNLPHSRVCQQLEAFLTSTTNGAFPPLILRRRDDRRVVERLRLRLGAIACPQRPHIFFFLGAVEGRPLFLYLFSVYAVLGPRPRDRPRPRPRPRRGGRGPDVRVDVRRTEGRPPSS